jgi:hypothetical protein
MTAMLIGVAGLAFVWWAAQLFFCLAWRKAMKPSPGGPMPESLPRFVVFIPVRGFDSTLLAAIRSVLALDYPAFTVRVLFDSREDVAWEPVQAELDRLRDPRISVQVIEHRRETCSLLCNNLVSAIEDLDDSHDLIAICAADMIVPPHWLRAMAAAMADPAVGATLGNRWYLPPKASAGGFARWMWNAGAVVLMRLCRIPWSGAMAIRLSELRNRGLLARWASAMVEDVSVAAHFAGKLECLRFVPELIVPDREDIGLASAFHFIQRQLLWSRLYSRGWLLIVSNALCGALATFSAPLLALYAVITGAYQVAAISTLVFLIYIAAMAALLRIVESGVARTQSERLKPFAGLPLGAVLVGIPLTQAVYLAAFCSAALARSVEWRGIRYEFDGPWKIRMLGYHPYGPDRERT